jgi:hypothetical protein
MRGKNPARTQRSQPTWCHDLLQPIIIWWQLQPRHEKGVGDGGGFVRIHLRHRHTVLHSSLARVRVAHASIRIEESLGDVLQLRDHTVDLLGHMPGKIIVLRWVLDYVEQASTFSLPQATKCTQPHSILLPI